MRRSIAACLLCAALLSAAACTRTQPISAPPAFDPAQTAACFSIFPERSFRAVHTIEISMPFDQYSTVIGITVADVKRRSLRCLLMSVEGLVLFDATYIAGQVQIHRALSPLDSASFARRLFEDVGLLFLTCDNPYISSLDRPGGRTACRWQCAGDDYESEINLDGSWGLRLYRQGELLKQVEVKTVTADGIAGNVELRVYGPAGYSMSLELLEAEIVEPTDSLLGL